MTVTPAYLNYMAKVKPNFTHPNLSKQNQKHVHLFVFVSVPAKHAINSDVIEFVWIFLTELWLVWMSLEGQIWALLYTFLINFEEKKLYVSFKESIFLFDSPIALTL